MRYGREVTKQSLVGELIMSKPMRVRALLAPRAETALAGGQPKTAEQAGSGAIVRIREDDDGWRVDEVLAQRKTARNAMYRLAAEHGLDAAFPISVVAEVDQLLTDPGIGDPALEDLTHLPFVTIDGPGTRDLDQAAYLETDGDGWVVWYALADPAFCVTPGSALFDEALRRGASYYFPGLAVPMLPRALSEGVVSLSEGEDRRAVVFRMQLDARGACLQTHIHRARVRSRTQLTFGQVERFLIDPAASPLPDGDTQPSIALLPAIGRARMQDAAERDVVHYRRTETELKLDESGGIKFVVELGARGEVEQYNAQLSLLCNVEGARFLREHADGELLQPIYRVHPRPSAQRLDELESLLAALCTRHALDASVWRWNRSDGQSLAGFLGALPHDGPQGRIAQAVHRQAVLTNLRSSFSAEPASHYGVGAEVYARFSAPMREIVGVFLHKEIFERIEQRAGGEDDEALREKIVDKANEAKALQKTVTRAANRYALDQLFEADRRRPRQERPLRQGTVMGLTRGKVHVLLDDPVIDVKVYTRDLGDVRVSDDGAELAKGETRLCRIGDAVRLRVDDRDASRDRWTFSFESVD
jgi:ribonuclease R